MGALKVVEYPHVIKEPDLDVVNKYLDYTDPIEYTKESLLDLGKRSGCTGGKGMVFLSSFDEAYEIMTTLEQMGWKEIELGEVQVRYDGLIGTSKWTLYVYTDNFENRDLIYQVRDSIICLCDPSKMFYKPDIYTVLGLKSDNEYDIRVSLYSYFRDNQK